MSFRLQGPLCRFLQDCGIDEGTLALICTPPPGPLGISPQSATSTPQQTASTTLPQIVPAALSQTASTTPSVTKLSSTYDAEIRLAAGKLFGESSVILPFATPDSVSELHRARYKMALVAYLKKRRMAIPQYPTEHELKLHITKTTWDDCVAAATEAYGKTSTDQFVHDTTKDGKTPDATSEITDPWPYDDEYQIYDIIGPFRKVSPPRTDKLYFFFYDTTKKKPKKK